MSGPDAGPEAEEGDERAQEAETRANVEAVMLVLEGLIAERDREIEQLCSSQYAELVSAVETLSHVRHGANEVAGAVQGLAADLKKEGEGLVGSMEAMQETQELVRNVSASRAAVQASLQALQLLAEAHGLCEEGKLYQAMRAVDIIRSRYLSHEEEGRARAALAAMQQQARMGGGGTAEAPPASTSSSSLAPQSTLMASFGPLRSVLTREVQCIVEEVDRQSLAGFHEWLVVARRDARAIGGLAMQHELEAMDSEDRLLLGQETLKSMLAVGEGPRDISKRLVSAGLVDQPPEDAFLPTLGHEQDSGDEDEGQGADKGGAASFLAGSKVLGRLDLTPLHRTMEIQRRLGKEAWFREYYLSNRRQQLVIDLKPSSESKQKEVAAAFIQRPQEYLASLVGFFVVERGVHLATHGAVTDPHEIASLFASMAPTLVELISQALDRAAGAALRTPGEDEAPEDVPVLVSAPQLLMVKAQIHVACQALARRGLDTTELIEMLWNYRKKFLEIVLKGAVEELKEKLFEPPPPPPPRAVDPNEGEHPRELPPPLPRWLERHKIESRDAEEEEHGTLGLPKPWLLRDGLDDGARSLAQAFTKFGGTSDQRRFMNQAVLSGLSKSTRDASRFPYSAPYSDLVPEVARVVRRSVDESGAFFRGLVGRSDVAALTRDFFLQRVLVRVVRDPIREFIQRPDTNITWAIQLSADCSALLHSITAMEEHVLLTGKGVTAARCSKENAAMLSLQRHRAPAPFASRFVRLEEYAVKAAAVEAMLVAEGTPHPGQGPAGALLRPSSRLLIPGSTGQGGGGALASGGALGRSSMNPYNRNHISRVRFHATPLGAMTGVAHEDSDHSDAWRVLLGLATDILSTTVERMVSLAGVRIKKVVQLEKYWYEEVYTDRLPPKKDWRGNILPEPPSPFVAPAPPQPDPTQPPFPEPLLWAQEVEADIRDYLKQCVELLPPEQCLQVHWRFFRGCVEQIFLGWRHADVGRWSHCGIRRLHSDLGVLEGLADRCQLDMVASGVYDKLGVTPKAGDGDLGLSGGGPGPGPRAFDLRDAMAEARQMVDLVLSCKPEAILDPAARSSLYPRIDLMGLYFLLDKYREPPGSTMAEMMAKFGKQDLRVAYFKRKEAEILAKTLMDRVKARGKEAQELMEQEQRLAMGITPPDALTSMNKAEPTRSMGSGGGQLSVKQGGDGDSGDMGDQAQGGPGGTAGVESSAPSAAAGGGRGDGGDYPPMAAGMPLDGEGSAVEATAPSKTQKKRWF